jgi:hypothetical protein
VGGAEADSKIQEQSQKIAKLRLAVEGLEKERDFYFAKLRDIEVMCQETEDGAIGPEFKEKILAILYGNPFYFIFSSLFICFFVVLYLILHQIKLIAFFLLLIGQV